MWKTLRAAVEDGVKDFSREAMTEFNTTLSDVRHQSDVTGCENPCEVLKWNIIPSLASSLRHAHM